MSEALDIAITKGGYRLNVLDQGTINEVALDRKFWLALHRAFKWQRNERMYHWHQLIDWLEEGRSLDGFFDRLVRLEERLRKAGA